ncbi:(2Fe-2S)-binding protein [Streptomyces sp. NPDC004609]|uniref:(2Fe-2S)-binding protein n=1 Tax=Streptomyces sp. NPDC004609 TaxID=3364704 RepID=UPI00367E5BD1
MRVTFTVNGRRQEADDVWEGESLLYVLRERMGLPGSKNACEQGECGSCTVRLDGVLVCSCLVAAGQAEGREIVTVEGLADHARRRDRGSGARSGGTSLQDARRWTADGTGSATGAGSGPPTGDGSPTGGRGGSRTGESGAPHPGGSPAGDGGGAPALSPVQQAFIDAGAVQCGFCTPGLLVAADDLLERNARPSDADIREALSGNLCRCTGYEKILDAVRLAAARREESL